MQEDILKVIEQQQKQYFLHLDIERTESEKRFNQMVSVLKTGIRSFFIFFTIVVCVREFLYYNTPYLTRNYQEIQNNGVMEGGVYNERPLE